LAAELLDQALLILGNVDVALGEENVAKSGFHSQ
jgi:hypothetical protein